MDPSYRPENFSDDRRKAIEKLARGRELATKLRFLLGSPAGVDGSVVSAKALVGGILESFSEGISTLNRSSDEVSQIPAGPPCWDGVKSEDSEESSKTSALKDRRGCYKRRKTAFTWSRDTPNLIDDGHAWRKYGQKVILNSKHPRHYYRCTHKFDQGCQATKQVQKIEAEPPIYRTTYYARHTCKNFLKPPQIIIDSGPRNSAFILSFSGNPNSKSPEPILPSFPLVKEERTEGEDRKPSLNNGQSSPLHYLLSPDLTAYDSGAPMLSSGSDHGEVLSSGVYSCTASTHSPGLDDFDVAGLATVGFDDDLLDSLPF